jgi:ribonuclease P/MRP protein subunit POP5
LSLLYQRTKSERPSKQVDRSKRTAKLRLFFSNKVNMAMKTKAAKPKVNPLPPSMRDKKRYVAFELASEQPLMPDADRKLISKMSEILGVFGSAKAGIIRVKYNPKTQRGLIRVDRKAVDHIRACFVMIKSIDNQKIAARTLRVSGMVNKASPLIE